LKYTKNSFKAVAFSKGPTFCYILLFEQKGAVVNRALFCRHFLAVRPNWNDTPLFVPYAGLLVNLSLVTFYPCDAMLAQYVLWPDVCLSVTSWSSIKTDGRIKLVYGTEAALRLPYAAFYGNLCTPKNKDTSPGNFVPNSELSRFFCLFATAR